MWSEVGWGRGGGVWRVCVCVCLCVVRGVGCVCCSECVGVCVWRVSLWLLLVEADAQCFPNVDAAFLVGLCLFVGSDPAGVWK